MSLRRGLVRTAIAATAAACALVTASGSASADPDAPWIGSGYSTNPHAVWCVQENLNYIITHYDESNEPALLSQDGIWGPKTEAAVRWWQARIRETQDGIVGNSTGGALMFNGDPYYDGTPENPGGYCYDYIPGYIIPVN